MRTAPLSRSLALLALAPAAAAQSFNVDFGEPGAGPPATYAAAGQPGFWNSIRAEHSSGSSGPTANDYHLVDVNGVQTTVGLHQYGGTELVLVDDPSITGDDATLLEDCLLTHSTSLESCLFLNGLQNGLYEVLIYGWMPNHPEVLARSRVDTVPGAQLSGGAWTGAHAEGVTYTRFFVQVTNGFMGPHDGLPAGGDTTLGGPLNAIQIRLLDCGWEAYCTAVPNSTGQPGSIVAAGSTSIAANNLLLVATFLPPNHSALFFYGWGQQETPLGNGNLCVSDGGVGFLFRLPPTTSDAGGLAFHQLDVTQPPHPLGQLVAGSTAYFSCWHRDLPAVGSYFNFTNAIRVTFCP